MGLEGARPWRYPRGRPCMRRYDEVFTTAAVTPNPIGLFATVASWQDDRLTVHDASQDPMLVRRTLATVFGIPESNVRAFVPYIGGAFGAGLRVRTHVILTALAARVVGRPVKVVLTRPQMFTSVGHRPESRQAAARYASTAVHSRVRALERPSRTASRRRADRA